MEDDFWDTRVEAAKSEESRLKVQTLPRLDDVRENRGQHENGDIVNTHLPCLSHSPTSTAQIYDASWVQTKNFLSRSNGSFEMSKTNK
jgi:hypothetical protein